MSDSVMRENSVLDPIDKRIVRALQFDPRLPFSVVADELGVAEQTIARRYRRLRRDGLVRVIGAVDARAIGETEWIVRVRCRPEGALQVAEALARRDDTAWVSLAGGGAEVVFSLHPRAQHAREDLLAQRLQRSAPVLDVSASMILHRFVGASPVDSRGRRLADPAATPVAPGDTRIEDADRPLLDLLARDGRTSYAMLARSTGLSPGRVMRRIEALQASGLLYFDLDIAPAALGTRLAALLWLTVTPAQLEPVAQAIVEHENTTYAAAITGPFNLIATLSFGNTNDLYRHMTTKLADLTGIHTAEISPVLRQLKQAGALMNGDRLAQPTPTRRRRR
ncbi:Lrp/AsnC family transcriptional regulator [Nocardia sp. NPDC059236]|uniref:Lrp/AsnC family transcriptional regulator n=1 Tax=Nocardia sp. NPDC059236 TaxID=3346783 RepID=UPI0036A7B06F